jgi:hypothetical protein
VERERLGDAQEELTNFGTAHAEVVNVTVKEEVEDLIVRAGAAFGWIPYGFRDYTPARRMKFSQFNPRKPLISSSENPLETKP